MNNKGFVEVDLGIDSPEYSPQAVSFINLFGPMMERKVQEEVEKLMSYATIDSKKNIKRLDILNTRKLANSLKFHAWMESGGDVQVFEAQVEWYAKFVELALGKKSPLTFIESVSKKNWGPLYRRDGGKRMARPFYMIEMLRQVRRFEYWMQKRYETKGLRIISSAFADIMAK